jgi:hypothetical protein
MAFLVAHGVGVVVSAARSRGAALPGPIDPIITGVATAIAGALLAGGAWSALRLATLEPFHRHGTVNLARMKGVEKGFEGISEVVGYVARNHQPGDLVYLYYSAEPGYLYYARQLGFRAPTITGTRSQGDFQAYAADLDALRGNARVWVVFSHTVLAERDFSVRHLESVGARLDYYRRPRADAYLFDLR